MADGVPTGEQANGTGMRRLLRKGIDQAPIFIAPMFLIASAFGQAGMRVFVVGCCVLLGVSLILRALERRQH